MSAHVLLNLLNELRKRDKMRGLPSRPVGIGGHGGPCPPNNLHKNAPPPPKKKKKKKIKKKMVCHFKENYVCPPNL